MGRATRRVLPAAVVLSLCAGAGAQTVYHVDDDGAGGDGLSWATAFAHLQDALGVAGEGDLIRVAQGVYRPDRSSAAPGGTGDRDATFAPAHGVTLAGGYAGVGADDPDENDPALYVTTLSGDLAGNDQPGFLGRGDNARHVVSMLEAGSSATISGVTIRGGHADGAGHAGRGGGVLADGGSPALTACVLTDNAAGEGGAIYAESGAAPLVLSCRLEGNAALFEIDNNGRGGALMARGADPDVRQSVFVGNSSIDFGGAVACEFGADASFVSCVFESNQAAFGGGIDVSSGSNPLFSNCLFVGNAGSVTGGAIRTSGGSAVVTGNCTFYGNTSNFGAVMFSTGNEASAPVVANAVLLGNEGLANQLFSPTGTIEVLFSCVEGGAAGIGNIDADPMLADPEGGDFSLLAGSACVDAGANTEVPEALLLDLAGNPRLVDDPGTEDTGVGPAPVVDMGAYELQAGCAGDFNGDGMLTVLDFVAFQQAWVAGDDAADCNGDGAFSVLDFVCFQQAFVAGCP